MDVREKLEVIAHLGDHITYKEDIGICYDSELAKVIEDAYMELKNGVTVQEWISVKDRLPTREDANETESILAINKDENYVGRWIWDIVARWPSEFTYWMPLPEPPKGE